METTKPGYQSTGVCYNCNVPVTFRVSNNTYVYEVLHTQPTTCQKPLLLVEDHFLDGFYGKVGYSKPSLAFKIYALAVLLPIMLLYSLYLRIKGEEHE